jgi:hypothetical protein
MYKTKLPLFASKEKHIGKKHYFILFLHKDFDRSKKLSQFTFNGQNFFFWLTPCSSNYFVTAIVYSCYNNHYYKNLSPYINIINFLRL